MKNVTTTATNLPACPYCGASVHVSTMFGVFGITCDNYCLESIRHEKSFVREEDCILDWQRRYGKEG